MVASLGEKAINTLQLENIIFVAAVSDDDY